jgi:hypothetical protein
MNENSQMYIQARKLALVLLMAEKNPTPLSIREKVGIAIVASKSAGCTGEIDSEELSKDIESLYSVWIDVGTALDDKKGHIDWLRDKKSKLKWRFWRRYERYLLEEKGLPLTVVNSLGDITDSIIERIEDPERPAPWDRRGMVVGSVQSGKTANYTGLICKAVDAGYKLIIILAGLHNNLRSQTQLRIDEGVLGFDTQKDRKFNPDNRIGVGLLQSEPLYIHSLTNSEERGDFKKQAADPVSVMIGGDPVILVLKKHKGVLQNLIQWALNVSGETNPNTRQKIIRNIPLLLIDDEADNASINTKKYDVSAINEKIRTLLNSFDKKAYVGYTATPFANIFINPDCANEEIGDDIFPRSFIINLPASSDYVGPSLVFGLDSDPDAGIEGVEPLPWIVKPIEDIEVYDPEQNKPDSLDVLPESLIEAIRVFILTCSARRARGQITVHNSMMIHLTFRVEGHKKVERLVKEELSNLQRRIVYGDGNSPNQIRDELERIWKDNFEKTTEKMAKYVSRKVTWDEVNGELIEAVSKIEVKTINGSSKDVLDYFGHPGGISVIAIGGNKLSRGLTLEGLSVSYYLRYTKMYDTLMQMGRWFGYRPGYLDLCRLYTTEELVECYRHITLAEQELRRDFDHMVACGLSPEDYGLRVRTHPDGLLITAINKMRSGITMQLSYAGELVQTAHFHKDSEIIGKNYKVANEFIESIGDKNDSEGHFMWQISGTKIVSDFIERLEIHPDVHTANRKRLSDYIKAQLTLGELTDWTVVLIHNLEAKDLNKRDFDSLKVGLTTRSEDQASTKKDTIYSLNRSNLIDPRHQSLDLHQIQIDNHLIEHILEKNKKIGPEERSLVENAVGKSLHKLALEITIQRWKNGKIKGPKEPEFPNGKVVRDFRPAKNCLLLIYALNPKDIKGITSTNPVIGFAISFPTSVRAKTVEYKVTKKYKELESEMDDE